MTGIIPTSSSSFGKMPDWRLTTEQISRLPSLIDGIDQNQELKLRQQATQFIQDMAERLNKNVQHRGKIKQVCICVSMVNMHRFFTIHSFRRFDPRDVAAACLFLAGKSEECPRKLEHIVEAWFKLKNMKAEVQPPFTETVRRDGAELIVFLESLLLQTIGFDFQVDLPHPIVINNMEKFVQNTHMIKSAYWFTSEIIRLTTFPVRYSIQTLACLSIYLVSLWADFEIPDSDGAPWFKEIEPEMTTDLLSKLADEFTRLYQVCGSSGSSDECRQAMDGFARMCQTSSAVSSTSFMTHQLPPPPPPPNLSAVKPNQQQHSQQQQKPLENGPSDQQRQNNKRPARTNQNEDTIPVKRIPTDADPATKKKISLNEYKQRLKMKQEPVVDELF